MGEVAPAMTDNVYRLQTWDGSGYAPVSKERCNTLVEEGKAEWVGTNYDEARDAYVHYADRIPQ